MRNVIKSLVLPILCVSVGLLSACGSTNETGSHDSSLVMRSYAVPASRAENLSQTLNNLLSLGSGGKKDVGRAWVAGPGDLLVLAPERMQPSIAKSLEQIAARQKNTTVIGPLRLNAWIVETYPGNGPDDAALKAIQPALAAFAEDMGPTHFQLDHYLTSISDSGAYTAMTPFAHAAFNYTISGSEKGIVLMFDYQQPWSNPGGNLVGLQGRVTLGLGQTTVLGLISDGSGNVVEPRTSGQPDLVRELLVVRVTPANPA